MAEETGISEPGSPTSGLILCEQAFSWLRHKVRTQEDAEWIYERHLPGGVAEWVKFVTDEAA